MRSRILPLVIGVGLGCSLLTGCGPGVAKTHDQRMNTYRASMELDLKQLRDDWDALWLADRQYGLTPWQIR